MSHSIEEQISVKLFVGSPIGSNLKLELQKSHQWKEAQITRINNNHELVETLSDGKKYIGFYIDSEKTIVELDEIKKEISNKIKEYCPNFQNEKLKFYVFPQVFVG